MDEKSKSKHQGAGGMKKQNATLHRKSFTNAAIATYVAS